MEKQPGEGCLGTRGGQGAGTSEPHREAQSLSGKPRGPVSACSDSVKWQAHLVTQGTLSTPTAVHPLPLVHCPQILSLRAQSQSVEPGNLLTEGVRTQTWATRPCSHTRKRDARPYWAEALSRMHSG